MQRYWEWLVGQVPSWIAPNLITIIGLATNVFTTLVLVYYCPTATEQVRQLWTVLSVIHGDKLTCTCFGLVVDVSPADGQLLPFCWLLCPVERSAGPSSGGEQHFLYCLSRAEDTCSHFQLSSGLTPYNLLGPSLGHSNADDSQNQ